MPSDKDSKLTASSTSLPFGTPIMSVPRTAGAGTTLEDWLCSPGRRAISLMEKANGEAAGRCCLDTHASSSFRSGWTLALTQTAGPALKCTGWDPVGSTRAARQREVAAATAVATALGTYAEMSP